MQGEKVGGFVLALAVFASPVLAMDEIHQFYIAHTLLIGWVLAEVVEGATRILLYRQGA